MTEVDPDNEATYKACVVKSERSQVHIPKEAVLAELSSCGFCEETTFAIKLALEEALANAVKHGNKSDTAKTVTVRYAINTERAVIIVRDEGPGFAPHEVPDPTHPERLALPSGRGIMLIKAYMDEIEYRDNGRELRIVKYRKRKCDPDQA